mmetsp:Transcript_47384/g.141416  ORF Transcript_47384/g.141416 Transcript_47384/m.141416 type:complete len:311 (+) Transcript_47384:2-934(+)
MTPEEECLNVPACVTCNGRGRWRDAWPALANSKVRPQLRRRRWRVDERQEAHARRVLQPVVRMPLCICIDDMDLQALASPVAVHSCSREVLQGPVHHHQVSGCGHERSEGGIRRSGCTGGPLEGQAYCALASARRAVSPHKSLTDRLSVGASAHPQAAIGLICILQCEPHAEAARRLGVQERRILVPVNAGGERRREAVEGLRDPGPAPPQPRHEVGELRGPDKVAEGALRQVDAVRDLSNCPTFWYAWPRSTCREIDSLWLQKEAGFRSRRNHERMVGLPTIWCAGRRNSQRRHRRICVHSFTCRFSIR